MEIESCGPSRLGALLRFWNSEFSHFPRFATATEGWLAERLDRGLLVAVDGDDVVGLIHVGVTPEEQCRARVAGWPGGTQGYVALFAVAKARRRRGIGTELWRAGKDALAGTKQVVIDGDGRNPWYARPPAFGAPWGPAVPWSDGETKKFLAMRGYGARAKAVEFADGIVVPEAEPEKFAARQKAGVARVAEWCLF